MANTNLITDPVTTPANSTANVTLADVAGSTSNNQTGTGSSFSPTGTSQLSTPQITNQSPAVAPQTVTLDNNTQTVQGQLSGILQKNSPLMQLAETKAMQGMNQRGLQNSSLAVGAAQDAVIQNAAPIAQADANITNQTAQFNANAQNTIGVQNMQEANKINIANLDAATKTNLADIEANYKTLMTADSGASQLYQQTVKNLTDIMGNKDMDAANKQAAIDKQTQMLRSGLTMIGNINNLNLSDILTF